MALEKDEKSTILKNFMAMKENQEAINKILSLEIKKLEILTKKLESGTEVNIEFLKEINKTIESLTMYQWINKNKIETITEFYKRIE